MAATNKTFQESVWMSHYNDLLMFQKESGKLCPGPKDEVPKLYHWCKNQRRFHKNGSLTEQRKELLDKAGFKWVSTNASFEDRLEQLVQFGKTHGTFHVSQVKFPKNSPEHKLSRWVNEMRRLYNENRLSIDRIDRLNKIGFIWNMEDERFAKNLKRLKRYHKEHQDFDVPQSGRYKKLGEWVAQVRCRGLSKPHYIKALNETGFTWEGKKKRIKKAKSEMKQIDIMNRLRQEHHARG